MKILIVNTSDCVGGAAVAANRLMEALCRNGEKAKMLVNEKKSDSIMVTDMGHRRYRRLLFILERLLIFVRLRCNRRHLFEIDTAEMGADITSTKEFREADIIHLHWINQGFLSLKSLRKIIATGKPIVWTMHDMWPATALCHYAERCRRFTTGCSHCRLLPKNGSATDLSSIIWRRKEAVLKRSNITFVACSRWLAREARQSALIKNNTIVDIPNCIDTHIFQKKDKQTVRQRLSLPTDKQLILFAAHYVEDERKGMKYLFEALDILVRNNPALKENLAIILLGSQQTELTEALPLKAFPMGYISDEQTIVDIYNAADVFVIPSLEDNLPNTVMEAMACGVPCVGFQTGGIPEMIDHKTNGYIAPQRDSKELAIGIEWTLNADRSEELSRAAVKKVVTCYSQDRVAMRYIDIYQQASAQKHFGL